MATGSLATGTTAHKLPFSSTQSSVPSLHTKMELLLLPKRYVIPLLSTFLWRELVLITEPSSLHWQAFAVSQGLAGVMIFDSTGFNSAVHSTIQSNLLLASTPSATSSQTPAAAKLVVAAPTPTSVQILKQMASTLEIAVMGLGPVAPKMVKRARKAAPVSFIARLGDETQS